MTEKNWRGVPPRAQRLASQGQRVRFHGGWLGESDMDRAIADWLSQNRGAAWPIIKWMLYMLITGQIVITEEGRRAVETSPSEEEEIIRALLNLGT